MKKGVIVIFSCIFLVVASSAYAELINSTTYKQRVIVSAGGENLSSASYKMGIAIGIINRVINSTSYINKLGFFHTIQLANGQHCTAAGQCEGGYCCSNICQSTACPSEEPAPSPAAAAGGGGGGGGGGGEDAFVRVNVTPDAQVQDFSVSLNSIKETVVLGASKTITTVVKNTGGVPLKFDLDVLTINNFVFLSDTSFSLEPGQEKIIEINIIGKQLGSYFGEIEISAEDIKKSISMVIDVESEQVLFDVSIAIPPAYKEVEAGKELKVQITLLNIGPPKKVDVTPTYIIKDKFGRIVYEASETFGVETQISYVKLFKIPKELQPGDYLMTAEVRYVNSFAVSSELFKVIRRQAAYTAILESKILSVASAVFAALTLLYIFAYALTKHIRKKHERSK